MLGGVNQLEIRVRVSFGDKDWIFIGVDRSFHCLLKEVIWKLVLGFRLEIKIIFFTVGSIMSFIPHWLWVLVS